jgi:hypothetical protein
MGFVVLCGLAGIAVHPTEDAFGVSHICGQPMVLMGVAFLAARYRSLPQPLRWLGLAGCAVDFALGVFLHFSLENQVFHLGGGDHLLIFSSPGALSRWAFLNFRDKTRYGLVYWGDYFAGAAGPIQVVVIALFVGILSRMARVTSGPAVRDSWAISKASAGGFENC